MKTNDTERDGRNLQNPPGTKTPDTTPAEERGERIDTGKTIARGGKTEGHVPGAEPAEEEGEGEGK